MSSAQTEVQNSTNPAYCATGIWAPLLMPLKENLDFDPGRMLALAEELLESGCHGLALFGTTSEANSFSLDERMAALEHCIKGGIDPAKIMVGTGCCAYPDSIRLTRHSLEQGCHMVLMLPPFYYKNMTAEGLANSYTQVVEAVKSEHLRILLYHFPALSGVPITAELIDILRDRHGDVIAGLKDSSGDWNNTKQLLESFPDLAIFPGTEHLLLDGLEHGSAGSITATANLTPAAIRSVYDRWTQNDSKARAQQEVINGTRSIIQKTPMVPTLKYLTSLRLKDPAWTRLRPPMVNLSEDQGRQSASELQAAGLDLG